LFISTDPFTILLHFIIKKVDKQKLEQEIRIDKLTELYNRYAFEEDIKSLNNSSTYTVIYLDIDDFSKFNNTYGHEAVIVSEDCLFVNTIFFLLLNMVYDWGIYRLNDLLIFSSRSICLALSILLSKSDFGWRRRSAIHN